VQRQSDFLDALGTLPDVRIIEGKFKAKTVHCNGCDDKWTTHEEKQTDVNIAVEMIRDAVSDAFDTALLLSGDSDLQPPVIAVQELALDKRVVVVCPPGRFSDELVTAASAFMTLGRKKLADSQSADDVRPRPSPPTRAGERARILNAMAGFWMSIEVLDGAFAASLWAEAWGDSLTEAALAHGAVEWCWQRQGCGVILEVSFTSEDDWERFRGSSTVRAALDSAPDPTAVLVYRGRGGSVGTSEPRRPRPLRGSGAAALPLPPPEPLVEDDFRVFADDIERRQLVSVGSFTR
jgi:hypothetical protein